MKDIPLIIVLALLVIGALLGMVLVWWDSFKE